MAFMSSQWQSYRLLQAEAISLYGEAAAYKYLHYNLSHHTTE